MYRIVNKRGLIMIIAIVAVIAGLIYLLAPKGDDNKPQESRVPQGETVTPNDTPNTGSGSSQNNSNSSQKPAPPPTTQELSDTIQESKSYLTGSNGQPTFGIIRVQEPLAGWFIVTVRIKGAGEPGKVILRQTNDPNNPLTTVAGPSTSFPPELITLPDAVRKAL